MDGGIYTLQYCSCPDTKNAVRKLFLFIRKIEIRREIDARFISTPDWSDLVWLTVILL